MSKARMETYLKAAGYDQDRALELYFWNMRISASFYPLLSSIEVCLRNVIERRLAERHGQDWWDNGEFHAILGTKGKGILLRATKAIRGRNAVLTSGRMTAELSFGFWSNMLLPKYGQDLWTEFAEYFPHAPSGINQSMMRQKSEQAKSLRNRIFHHEPIIGYNLTQHYGDGLLVLNWLSPAKRDWLKPRLSTMQILRERP